MKRAWGFVLVALGCAGAADDEITDDASPDAFAALVKEVKASWESDDRAPRWRRTVTVVGSQSKEVEECSPGEYRCYKVRRVVSSLPDAWQRAALRAGAPIVLDSADFDPSHTYLAVISATSDSLTVLDFTVDGGWQALYEYDCSEGACTLSKTDSWCHVDYYAGSPLEIVAGVMDMMVSSCVSEAAGR